MIIGGNSMDDYVYFEDAYELLTEQDNAYLKRGIFLGMNAEQKTKEFCKRIKMDKENYSLLMKEVLLSSKIARTACLLGLVATKVPDCNNRCYRGYNITIKDSGDERIMKCSIQIEGYSIINLVENTLDGGWDILFIHPGVIRTEPLIELLLEYSADPKYF